MSKNNKKSEAVKAVKKSAKPAKEIGANEIAIAEYIGTSVRKMAEAWREKNGKKFPVVYKFCASTPIRSKDGKRVLVEGRYELGCVVDGKKEKLATVFARLGFKLPCGGSVERCDELLKEYRDAISKQGKFAPKAKKGDK